MAAVARQAQRTPMVLRVLAEPLISGNLPAKQRQSNKTATLKEQRRQDFARRQLRTL